MMIEIKNLNKKFQDNNVLKNLNIKIKKGESAVVIGQSGTGKSVMLKCLLGLINPDKGSIRINNKEKLFHHLGVYGYKRRSLEKFIKTKQSKREQDLKLEQLRALDNGMSIVIDLINKIPIGVDTEDDLYNVRKELSNKT